MNEVRLIDANALKEVIRYNQEYVNPKLNIENVIHFIDNAPSISPEKALMDKLRGDKYD